MKLQINAKKLNEYVKKCIGCISDKSSLQLLSHIVLKVKEPNIITLQATNLELAVQVDLTIGSIEGECETSVNAKRFSDMLSSFKNDDVFIVLNNNNLEINAINKRSIFKIPALSIDEFPEINFPDWNTIKPIEIDNFELKQTLSSVIYAASIDDGRYFLQGAYIEQIDNGLQFVSTDGKRLALHKVFKEIDTDSKFDAIIPKGFVSQILNSIPEEGTGLIYIDGNKVYFKSDVIQYSSNLLEGKYPDYKQIIPNDHEFSFRIKVADLLDSMQNTTKILTTKWNRVELSLSELTMKVAADNIETGTFNDEISIQGENIPDNFKIAFNYQFIIDLCNAQLENEIEWELRGFDKSVLVHPVTEKGKYFSMIMPMQLRNDNEEVE